MNTPCNTSCGGGVMMKVRSCTNPRPQGKDGKDCEGIDKQYFPCNEKPCDMQVGVLTDAKASVVVALCFSILIFYYVR